MHSGGEKGISYRVQNSLHRGLNLERSFASLGLCSRGALEFVFTSFLGDWEVTEKLEQKRDVTKMAAIASRSL